MQCYYCREIGFFFTIYRKMQKMEVNTVLLLALSVGVLSQPDVVIQTQQGSLRGTTLTSVRDNITFFAFMGIPYAKPPVGPLRFQPPQPADAWNGTRDAALEGPPCPQKDPFTYIYEGDEDCLFLNVYARELPTGAGDSLKAVLVWIHGGGWHFFMGDRNVNGPDYFMTEDVVLVVMNYRLGALGFLSLPEAGVHGNSGLKDQVMALRWVQQNIAQFGGDPGRVTVFGASAGGASVHYHLLSPMSQGLFQRAILQSGSGLNSWAFNSAATNRNNSFGLTELLGFNTSDPQEVLQILLEESPEKILNLTSELMEQAHGIPLHPIADITAPAGEIFLPDNPRKLVRTGRFHQVSFIAGVNNREGIWDLNNIKSAMDENRIHLEEIPAEMDIELSQNRTAVVAEEIRKLYFGNLSVSEASLDQHITLSGDQFWTIGVYLSAKKHSEQSSQPVYFYEFSYSGGMSMFKKFAGGENLTGSCHLDDTAYLFRMARVNQTFEDQSAEVTTSRRIVKLWSNFAKTGNPTPEADPLLQNAVWTPVTSTDFTCMEIGEDLSLKHNYDRERMAYWENLYEFNPANEHT